MTVDILPATDLFARRAEQHSLSSIASPILPPIQSPPLQIPSQRIENAALPRIQHSLHLPPDPHGRIHPLTDLKNRILRGDSIVFNNDGLWETIKKMVRAVCGFFGISTAAYLEPVAADGTYDSRNSINQALRKLVNFEKGDDLRLVDFAIDYLNTYETENRWTKGVGEAPFQTQEARELIDAIKQRLLKHMTAEKKELKLTRMINERKEVRAKLRVADQTESGELHKELSTLNSKLREAKKKAYAHLGVYRLERHLHAFHDREMKQSDIMTRTFNPNYLRDKKWLEESTTNWKKGVWPKLEETPATKADEAKKIADLLCYPEVLKLLRKDPISRDAIYKLIFRNMRGKCDDSAHIATQFPATSERITSCFLDKREGRLGNFLTFSEHIERTAGRYTLSKQVRFKMNGEDVSLNDRSRQIAFSASYSRTVEEILKSFAKKNVDIGEFDCVESKGILRLHPLPVDLNQADWHKQIPVFETLDCDQMMQRYGRLPEEAFIVVKASRQHQSTFGVRVDDTHGWMQVVMKDEENEGRYKVYPFGKYPDPTPQSFFEKIFFVFGTQLGVVRMDENEYYNQREQQQVVIDAPKTAALRVFDKIKVDLQKEKTNDIIFQAQGDNCAAWVKSTVDYAFQDMPNVREQLKDLYEVSWLKCETTNSIISGIQFVGRHVSEVLGNILRICFSILMGAWRGFSTNNYGTPRLIFSGNFLRGNAIIPAQLFKQATEFNARLKRVVPFQNI